MNFFSRTQWTVLAAGILALAVLLGVYTVRKRMAEHTLRLLYAIPWEAEEFHRTVDVLSAAPFPYYEEVYKARKELHAALLRCESAQIYPAMESIFKEQYGALHSYRISVAAAQEWEHVFTKLQSYLEAYGKFLSHNRLVIGADSVLLDYDEARNNYQVLLDSFPGKDVIGLHGRRYDGSSLSKFELFLITRHLWLMSNELDRTALQQVSKQVWRLQQKQAYQNE